MNCVLRFANPARFAASGEPGLLPVRDEMLAGSNYIGHLSSWPNLQAETAPPFGVASDGRRL
jgi:hypothetical protein